MKMLIFLVKYVLNTKGGGNLNILEQHDAPGTLSLLPGRKNGAGDKPAPDCRSLSTLSLIHISEPTRLKTRSRMPSSA